MSRKTENTSFVCAFCNQHVIALTNGSFRNHCPFCLYSLHVDDCMGDRQSDCFGLMKPTEIVCHSKKGYQIKHECLKCDAKRVCKIAEHTKMPDDFEAILKLIGENL